MNPNQEAAMNDDLEAMLRLTKPRAQMTREEMLNEGLALINELYAIDHGRHPLWHKLAACLASINAANAAKETGS